MTPYISIICQQEGHKVANEYAKLTKEVGLPVLVNFPSLEGFEQANSSQQLVNPSVGAVILVISSDFFPASGKKTRTKIPPETLQAIRSAASDMAQVRLIPVVIDDDSLTYIENTWLKDLQYFKDGPIERESVRSILRTIADREHLPEELYSFEKVGSIIEAIEPGSDVEKVGGLRESSEKIGYQVFSATNRIKESVTYYIYLNKGISLKRTSDRLKRDHPEISDSKNKYALLGIEPGHVRLNERLANVKTAFECDHAVYLENIVSRLISTSVKVGVTGSSTSGEREFVEPQVRHGIATDAPPKPFSVVEKWLTGVNAGVRVMQGQGGIGKTWAMLHLRQKASLSKLNFTRPGDRTILFIASTDVNKVLAATSLHRAELTLYDLYVASQSSVSTEILNKETFYNAIELGSLIVFVDGFDEIIARNRPRFNSYDFFTDIEPIFRYGSAAKILISCRNIFFDQDESLWDFPFVDCWELLAFDGKRRDIFFEDGLPGMPNRINHAKTISEELAKLPDNRYVPFVLSLVKDLVLEHADGSEGVVLRHFHSEFLNESDVNDRVVGQFCNREISKVPDPLRSLNVDQQVRVFCEIARTKEAGNGAPRDETIRQILEKVTERKDVENLVDHLTSHPFISQEEYNKREVFEFRFDFLPEYFLMIDASLNCMNGASLELADIRIMNKYCNSNSLFSQGVVQRFDGDELSFFVRLLEMNAESWVVAEATLPSPDLDILRPDSAIAQFSFAIVGLLATYVSESGSLDAERFTNGVCEIFMEDGVVRKMAILDGFFKEEERIRIDFRGRHWDQCLFHSVDIWSCQFDSETKFSGCKFQHCEGVYNKASGVMDAHFEPNCIFDDVFEKIYSVGNQKVQSDEARVVEDVKSFVSDFHSQGAFWKKNLENLERFYGQSNPSIPFKKLMRQMRRSGVIVEKDMGHYVDVTLSNEAIEAAERLITQGVLEGVLRDAVVELVR
ncbi:hypothetical protein [Roseovarius sp. ZX-A-9]|uniref:hypothetical protein n=1 Tax=Roseovarius sp. ZX-A-9 TaxID=3014783 RepID=UPI00232CAEA2|nr:hypothetical protein [Roseovarius sp. ZX-A-9]